MELPGQFAFSVSATAAGMSDHCANRLPAGKPDLRVMLDPRPESATMRRTQMKTPRWSWMVVAALVAVGAPDTRAELVNGIKAIVHDTVITYDEVNLTAAPALSLLHRQFRNNPEGFRAKMAEVLDENLEQLLQRQLVLRDFAQTGHDLPESLVDEIVQDEIRRRFGGDRVKLAKTLQSEGLTLEKFRQRVRDQFVVEALRAQHVTRNVIISPHKIERYYQDNRDKFHVEDRVKLRMIVLTKAAGDPERTRRLMEEIVAKVKEGATFAEMASVYSQGSQRSQGGDWGWIERSTLRRELAEVAFALRQGELSAIVELPDAFYLMQAEEVRPAHVRPLSEVREEIEHTLAIEERGRMEKRYIEKLRNKTFVRYF
jgi:peptidyl-prolyl cis-trans isomerase SurA